MDHRSDLSQHSVITFKNLESKVLLSGEKNDSYPDGEYTRVRSVTWEGRTSTTDKFSVAFQCPIRTRRTAADDTDKSPTVQSILYTVIRTRTKTKGRGIADAKR